MSFKLGTFTSQSWEATTAAHAVQPVSTDLDIHCDASRAKIVIRPRCKQYVKKQRSLKRTLACFTSHGEAARPGSPIASDPSSSISSSSAQISQEENRNSSSAVAKTDKASGKASFERSGRSRNATPKVVTGRVEKRPKQAKPCSVPISEKDNMLAPVSPTAAQYDCTCPDPTRCARCRLLALADHFCAIVVAREQHLKMYASTNSK